MIAMGFPSSGTEAVFRNPANQVRAFIEKYHAGHCKVYNLCIEKKYDASILGLPNHLVEQHGCFDHNPAPLICVLPFCESARRWLEADPKNVVAVHCKAGKGRTGMMLSALMVYMKEHPDSTRALELFGKMRTKNSKGVTIPSQKRYVGYAEQLLLVDQMPLRVPPLYTITKIVLHTAPDVAMDPKTSFTVELVHQQAAVRLCQCHHAPRACKPLRAPSRAPSGKPPSPPVPCLATLVQAPKSSKTDLMEASEQQSVEPPQWQSWKVYDHAKMGGENYVDPQQTANYVLDCPEGAPTLVAGDVKIVISTPKGKLTQFWFHTGFATFKSAATWDLQKGGPGKAMRTLHLPKSQLDKVCKDKKDKLCPRDFAVCVHLRAIADESEKSEVERRRSVLVEEIAAGIASINVTDFQVLGDSGDEETDDEYDDDDDIIAVAASPRDGSISGGGRELVAEAVVVGTVKARGKSDSASSVQSGSSTPRVHTIDAVQVVRK